MQAVRVLFHEELGVSNRRAARPAVPGAEGIMSHGVTMNGVRGVAIQIRNRMFREAVAAQVDGEPDLRIVGTTAFCGELPRLVELRNPEIVLFEIDPDQGDPAGVVAELRVRYQRLHLVGLYDRPDPEIAERL